MLTKYRLIGMVLIVVAIVLAAAVIYRNSLRRQIPLVFSHKIILDSTWANYKNTYIERGSSRTLDKQRQNITTSEGQSYTMMRAVWLDDKSTFDSSWQWTKANLQRQDKLFSWLYGKLADGTFGVEQKNGASNSASDADVDIALSLIFAYERWREAPYLEEALPILRSIWDNEVLLIGGKPYLLANNLEKNSNKEDVIVNPSYFAPYAYKVFFQYDRGRQWLLLAGSSYDLLERAMNASLGGRQTKKLPPDWLVINRKTGELGAHENVELSTNFGYDALRVPWRITLDWQWFADPRAKALLEQMQFLADEWNEHGLLSLYHHDGSIAEQREFPALYGGTIGFFSTVYPEIALEIYRNKLVILFDPDRQSWKKELSYYDDNWAWFGMAMYHKVLPNLSAPRAGSQ